MWIRCSIKRAFVDPNGYLDGLLFWPKQTKVAHLGVVAKVIVCSTRDCYMHHTFKGIYTKFSSDNGRISNVVYENIYIEVLVFCCL